MYDLHTMNLTNDVLPSNCQTGTLSFRKIFSITSELNIIYQMNSFYKGMQGCDNNGKYAECCPNIVYVE